MTEKHTPRVLGRIEPQPPNKAGFRVRSTDFLAPAGAHGFTQIDGIYYWTDMNWSMDKPGMNSQATRSQP